MRSSSPSFARSTSGKLSNYARSFDLPDDDDNDDCDSELGDVSTGSMLPIFLNDIRRNHRNELVEITLELDDDSTIVLCSVTPPPTATPSGSAAASTPDHHPNKSLWRSLSATSRIRKKFGWLRSGSSRTTASEIDGRVITERDARRIRANLQRSKSSAERALKGLKFISKASSSTAAGGGGDAEQLWRRVESRFDSLSSIDGFLARDDFGECIGMVDSKEFAGSIFDALARRKGQRISRITKAELREFWLQITDNSFDARLQIFFDM